MLSNFLYILNAGRREIPLQYSVQGTRGRIGKLLEVLNL